MKKRVLLLCICLLIISILPSCNEKDKQVSIYIYIGNIVENSYDNQIITNITFAATMSPTPITVSIFNFSDFSDENLIDDFMNEKPDSLIVRASSTEEANTLLNLAKKENIPVIFYGISPSEEIFSSYQNCWYIQYNPALLGEVSGTVIANAYRDESLVDKDDDLLLDIAFISEEGLFPFRIINNSCIHSIEDTGLFTSPLYYSPNNPSALESGLVEYADYIEAIFFTNEIYAIETLTFLIENEIFTEGEIPYTLFSVGRGPEILEHVSQGYIYGIAFENPSIMSGAVYSFSVNAAYQRNVTENTSFRLGANRVLSLPVEAVTIENVDIALSTYAPLE